MKRLLIAISSVILALVIVMIVVGSMTFEGTVVKDPYTTALQWDSSHHERVASGWQVTLQTPLVRSSTAELIISITDVHGKKIKDAVVDVFLTRPSTNEYDSNARMVHKAAGTYSCPINVPVRGRWLARLSVSVGEKTVMFNETIYVD